VKNIHFGISPLFSLLIFLCFSLSPGFSQNQAKVDSLLGVLEGSGTDTNKAKLLDALSHEYYYLARYDEAVQAAEQSLRLAKELAFMNGIASSSNNLGVYYSSKGDYNKAINHYLNALKIREESNDSLLIARSLDNLGAVYSYLREPQKALEHFERSLSIKEKLGDMIGVGAGLGNIGIIYKDLGNLDKALEYEFRCLKILEALNERKYFSYALNTIGRVYEAQGNFDKALEYHQRSLAIKKELGNRFGIASSLNNIASVYSSLEEYDKAKQYLLNYLELAIDMGAKEKITLAYGNLAELSDMTNDYQNAYEYHKLFAGMRDSMLNEDKQKQIVEMQTKYETEKKEKENALLTQQNKIQALEISRNKYMMYGLGGVTILVILIAFLFIQQNRLRAQQRTMQAEQRLLRSQMNPHFISNSLIAIQSFIYKKDPKEAGKYLASFAKLMRLILENSREEFVPLDKEIKTLEHYLELQALRFENKFEYSIDVNPKIDTESIGIPPMLAQPFIENALEHGILHNNTQGKIKVCFNLEGDLLLLDIEDNGIGRQKAGKLNLEDKESHKSLATTITRERLAILNKKNKQKIKLEITDLERSNNDMVGTRATFHIPYRNV